MERNVKNKGASLTNGNGFLSGQDVGMAPLEESSSTTGATKNIPAALDSTEPASTVGATKNVPTTTDSNTNIPPSVFECNAADNTGKEQGGKLFAPGISGNPAGRPKGSRNKATLAVQALLEGEAEAISRKAIELAKMGEMGAIKLVLERVLPPRKDTPVQFTLPALSTAESIPEAMAAIIAAVGQGELTPAEGQAVAGLLELHRKAIETCQLERKLESLQAILQPRK